MIYQNFIKPFLFLRDAEKAHEMALSIASKTHRSALLQKAAQAIYHRSDEGLGQQLFGLSFPNPIGLAAGFDKNGTTPKAMQALGFGFIEIGSITAQSASGNPRPRAFRIPKDHSLINRMGLNNDGAEVITKRLSGLDLDIPLGVNIAKTHDPSIYGDLALEDYAFSFKKAQDVADYVTINISCPNTEEGKTFEDPGALLDLLQALDLNRAGLKPSLVKFSVDTERDTLARLIQICEDHGVSGYVATNTSSYRGGLNTPKDKLEEIGKGGLSGRAIRERSTQVVKWISEITEGNRPLIGVGGIDDAESALEKLTAGAHLIQVYTGLVYQGPGLLKVIKKGLKKDWSPILPET